MIIKIIGSGSAGNHIAYAFKKLAKKIYMFDLSSNELKRSKKIYISRYKNWNNNIIQKKNTVDKNFYDLVIISSPPITHYEILKKNLHNSNNFLIEKPLLEPSYKTIKKFFKIYKKYKNKNFFCGYNHRLFPSVKKLKNLVQKQKVPIDTIEVNFKENTEGFLKAHYWLRDLRGSYLSKYKQGGGSLLEHSHAINLAQFFCNDNRDFIILNKNIKLIKDKFQFYDKESQLILKSNDSLILINQNFVTWPIEKNITISNKNFFSRLIFNFDKNNDRIIFFNKNKKKIKIFDFKKQRSDDFKYEAEYLYNKIMKKNLLKDNTLDSKHALYTMQTIMKILG